MKKTMCLFVFATLLALAGYAQPSGSGLFSVSKGGQVRFAPGNLEYDSIGGYRFAAHQYDYGGYFAWGTGSNPTFATAFTRNSPSFDDWGSHIGGWRTLSREEWHYVIWDRPNASDRCGAATVCDVHGMVLLPDKWSGTFEAGFNGWSTNVYDTASWAAMEAAGAVFLPAAGYRFDTKMKKNIMTSGLYWSSTLGYDDRAYGMVFYDSYVVNYDDGLWYYGRSVRLVKDK